MFSRRLGARVWRRHLCRVGKGAERRAHAVHSLRGLTAWASLRSAHPTKLTTKTKKRKRNADRREVQPAVPPARPRILRDAHIYRRSTAVLPWGVFHPQVQLQAMLPGTWQSADPLIPRQGEDPHAVYAGVTRPNLSHVQRAPRVPVRSAGRLMPEAARERFASPPAGTALAPLPRFASGAGPSRERDSLCNRNGYHCQ